MSEWITVNPEQRAQTGQGGWVTVNPVREEEEEREGQGWVTVNPPQAQAQDQPEQAGAELAAKLTAPGPEDDPLGIGIPQSEYGSTARKSQRDLATFATDLPRAVASGAARFGRSVVQASQEVTAPLAEGVENFMVESGAPTETAAQAREAVTQPVDVPQPQRPTTTAGRLTEGITQFASGFVGPFKAMRGARLRGPVAGTVADLISFGPHEQRLSNLVEEFPALSNPVTQYLQADPEDSAAEGRLKNVLEGLGAGAAVDALRWSLRGLRGARAARGEKLRVRVTGASGGKPKVQVVPERIPDADTEVRAAETRDAEAAPPPTPAQGAPAAAPVQASEEVTRAADAFDPEAILRQREVGREAQPARQAPRAQGQTVRTLSADDELASVRANILEAGEFREARRSGTPIADTAEAARRLGMTEEELLNRPAGQAYNAEQLMRAQQIANDSALRAQQIARNFDQLDEAGKREARERLVREYAIQEQAVAVRSESGRAQRALREAQAPERQMRRAIENIRKGDHTLDEQMRLIATLDDPAQVQRFARNVKPASTWDKLLEVWVNALLSGKALLVNPASNMLVAAYSPIERAVASGLTGEIGFRESLAQTNGMIRGMRTATREAIRAFLTEETPDLFTKIEARHPKAIGGRTGKLVRTPGRILESQDVWFKMVNYAGELEAQALRRGTKKGLKGRSLRNFVRETVANPPEDLHRIAWDKARTNTFTVPLAEQEGWISEAARLVQRGNERIAPLKLFFPFVRTPTNIFKFTAQRTLLAPLLKDFRNEIAAGGARRAQAMAQVALGTMLSYEAASLAAEGRITGGGPADPNQRRIWRMTHEPYSIKVGDKWVNYGRLEPIGSLVGLASDAVEVWDHLDDRGREGLATLLGTLFARQVQQKTFVQGMSALAQAATGEVRFVDELINLTAGSAIPSGAAELARANDNVVRDTRSALDRILSRIPFASRGLEPLMTLWGEEIRRGDPVANLLSPVYINPIRKDKVAEEMQRLRVSPQMPERQINGVELTGPQYTQYVKLAGRPAKDALDGLVSSPGWQRMPDFFKRTAIERVITSMRAMARAQMISRNPEIRQGVIAQRMEGLQEAAP